MKRKTMKRNFSNGGNIKTDMKQLIEEKQRFWISGNNTYKVNICEFTSDLKYYPTNSYVNRGRDILIKYKNIVIFFKLLKGINYVFDIPRNNVKSINEAFNKLDKAIQSESDVTKIETVKSYISSNREPILGSFCRSYKDEMKNRLNI